MATEQKSALNIVMGAMTFGKEGAEGARVHTIDGVSAILDVFQKHGHTEIDTARTYTGGSSEEFLGEVGWQQRGLKMETKLYPNVSGSRYSGTLKISHSPEDLRKFLDISLETLKTDSVDIWYLHAPDRTTPYEVTFKAVNELYKEGKFKRLGISNYMSWEVAEIVGICKANGYIQPTVFQGIYNAVHRTIEPELIPCLRKFGISFYAFNPLAGGFFTGRYTSLDDKTPSGSRFDPEKGQGRNYRKRYWNEHYFNALSKVSGVAEKHGLTLAEVALRWISHHSLLRREFGDAVLIGASSVEHIEQNLVDLEKGPLPEEVVQVLNDAWLGVKIHATDYWH